jgi:hypothetical protein
VGVFGRVRAWGRFVLLRTTTTILRTSITGVGVRVPLTSAANFDAAPRACHAVNDTLEQPAGDYLFGQRTISKRSERRARSACTMTLPDPEPASPSGPYELGLLDENWDDPLLARSFAAEPIADDPGSRRFTSS